MTAPTLTYGTGFLEDCLDDSVYTEHESSLVCALTVSPADIFKLTGTCNDAGDEYAYYKRDISALDFDPTDLNWLIRYRTSAASAALGAKVELIDKDAGSEVIFGATPQFNQTWTIATGAVVGTKALDEIRFYADDYPNTVAAGTSSVYYDFLMFYEDVLTFPRVCTIKGEGGLRADFGNKIAKLPLPSRDTDEIQKMGRRNTIFTLSGDMMDGEGWGTPYGLPFLKALNDTWCWFTCDAAEMKVVVKDFRPNYDASTPAQALFDLVLEEFSYSDKGHSSWGQKGWLGI